MDRDSGDGKTTAALARGVLLAAAHGSPVDAEDFAFAVLGSHPDELVRLAAAVLVADAHRGRRTVELAAAVIDREGALAASESKDEDNAGGSR